MLTTFMWFGIGIMGAATLILWLLFPALTSWYEKNWPEDTPEDTKEASSVMISLATIFVSSVTRFSGTGLSVLLSH